MHTWGKSRFNMFCSPLEKYYHNMLAKYIIQLIILFVKRF